MCYMGIYIYMVYVQTSLDNCVLCRQIWDSLSVRSRFGWVWPIECGVLHGYIYIWYMFRLVWITVFYADRYGIV